MTLLRLLTLSLTGFFVVSCLFVFSSSFLNQAAAATGGAGPDRVTKQKKARKPTRKKRRKRSRNLGLSGQKGNVRGYPKTRDGCRKLYNQYIKASGHSAYAATPGYGYQASVCGVAINRRSVSSAESAAMRTCRNGLKRYKVAGKRGCVLYMSK